jgi:hypothetical protein
VAIAIYTTSCADTTMIVMLLNMLKLPGRRPKVDIQLPKLLECCTGASLGMVGGCSCSCILQRQKLLSLLLLLLSLMEIDMARSLVVVPKGAKELDAAVSSVAVVADVVVVNFIIARPCA